MGFDIERFSGNVNEGLLCSICRDVLEDPLQAPCEHAFCSSCIYAWLTHYNTCPEDRLPLWPSDLKPIFRYMRNDLDALKIRCDNESRGCKALVRLDALKTHLKEECGFVLVSCSNDGCNEELTRREFEAHLKACKFQTAECAKGCGLKVSKSKESEHNCIAELRKAMTKNQQENEARIRELKQEMESRLDSHRVHMVYKEATLQNQIEDLNSQVTELLREIKSLKAQKRKELQSEDPERKEILEWLRSLKYQDEIAERYCSSCNKRYLYVRKDTLHCLNDQVKYFLCFALKISCMKIFDRLTLFHCFDSFYFRCWVMQPLGFTLWLSSVFFLKLFLINEKCKEWNVRNILFVFRLSEVKNLSSKYLLFGIILLPGAFTRAQ